MTLTWSTMRSCPRSSVVNALGRYVQWSVTHLGAGVQNSVLVRLLSTKELFQIIPMHMMKREIIRAEKRGLDRCPL